MFPPLLTGLRVLDLSSVLAGPLTGSFFAECGAEVIKVENALTGGDVTRGWRAKGEKKEGISAYYAAANWGKEVWMLDLTQPAQRQQVYEAVKKSDLVIANFLPASAQKLGLSYEHLRALQPAIILGEIRGFREGDGRAAYDLVLQAESGFMYLNRSPEMAPLKMPVALIDILAAHQLKEGLLLALLQKMRTGAGARVSVSLLETASSSLANQATNWLMAGADPAPLGSLHPNIAPYGEMFSTADHRQIVLAIGSDKQFAALMALCLLNMPAAWAENKDRVLCRQEIKKVLEPAFGLLTASEWMTLLAARHIPAGEIKKVSEVLEDPAISPLLLHEYRCAKAAPPRASAQRYLE